MLVSVFPPASPASAPSFAPEQISPARCIAVRQRLTPYWDDPQGIPKRRAMLKLTPHYLLAAQQHGNAILETQ
jgi:hypothetical protein